MNKTNPGSISKVRAMCMSTTARKYKGPCSGTGLQNTIEDGIFFAAIQNGQLLHQRQPQVKGRSSYRPQNREGAEKQLQNLTNPEILAQPLVYVAKTCKG